MIKHQGKDTRNNVLALVKIRKNPNIEAENWITTRKKT